MIVSIQRADDADRIRRHLAGLGLWVVENRGNDGQVSFLIESHSGSIEADALLAIEGIKSVALPRSSHPLVDAQPEDLEVCGTPFSKDRPAVLMAGPCAIESPEQIHAIARRIAAEGAQFIRGGAFKPRSSPYAFQGHGRQALGWIRAAADAYSLKVVTEALGESTVAAVADHADLIQIGSRNMHNYTLLREVAGAGLPVLLKRGMAATIEEWLLSGEYLLHHGAEAVVFCERGIRGFDGQTRNLLDLSAVALLAHVHHLPVIVDPSHALGRRDLALPLSLAARAAGAAGLIVETHDHPGESLSDGPQALRPEEFHTLARALSGEGLTPQTAAVSE